MPLLQAESPMSRTLSQWVDYIQTLHHREIELSLERVDQVYRRMLPAGVPFKVVSVSGTNGKGSSAELISSIFRSEGYAVAKYTSPHLVRFNERINIEGKPVSDDELLKAFERVESVRGSIPITFFEFGTLVAIECFVRAGVDLAVMEVGLGGRLDAVNILDADVSAVTSISVDHTGWLGNTVEEIAVEKAGIARRGRPCVLGMEKPPQSLIDTCAQIGAFTQIRGRDFGVKLGSNALAWGWERINEPDLIFVDLPLPFGQSGVQLDNAALAIEVVTQLANVFPVSKEALRLGLANADILGRCQILNTEPLIILDVAHNEASVAELATFVQRNSVSGKTIAVCGMLRDKEIASSLRRISHCVSEWHVATLKGERATSAKELKHILCSDLQLNDAETTPIYDYASIIQAYGAAKETLTTDDCLVVFGSFFVVGDILELLNEET